MRNLTLAIAFVDLMSFCGAASAVEYTFEEIHIPGTFRTQVYDINNLDQYVGIYSNPDFSTHAYYFDGSEYVTFDFPGADSTTPSAINDHGVIAGHYEIGDSTTGFLYENGEFTSISLPGARYTQFWGVNNARQVVGSYQRADLSGFGFVLEADGSIRELAGPDGERVSPRAIANDGVILGSISVSSADITNPQQGLLIDGSTLTVIPRRGHSLMVGDLTDGHVVVGSWDPSPNVNVVYGFVDSGKSFTYINAPDARQTYFTGVNNKRVIVGGKLATSDNQSHSFLARPVPEPSALLLVAIAAFCGSCIRAVRFKVAHRSDRS